MYENENECTKPFDNLVKLNRCCLWFGEVHEISIKYKFWWKDPWFSVGSNHVYLTIPSV